MADFIPDSQFMPDNAAPKGDDFIPNSQFQSDEEKYGSLGQQVKTGIEGIAKGVAGPLAPLAERALGENPEDIRLREEANPIAHGAGEAAGFVGSMLTGVGELPLIESGVKAAGKALGLKAPKALAARVAGNAIKTATETALIQGGDEISKLILEDPEQSSASAIANIGTAAAFGGALGTGTGLLSPLWKATVGNKVGQMIEDFKGRLNYHLENPEPVEAVIKELGEHYNNIKSMADEVYGPEGLKSQDIAKAVPEISEKILSKSSEIEQKLVSTIEEMKANPDLYPPRLVAKLEKEHRLFASAIEGEGKTAAEHFNAAQDLKKQLQEYSRFDRMIKPVDETYDFVQKVKSLGHDLRQGLEDSNVWGKAAERQKSINKAFSDFLPSLKDFEKKFTVEVNGVRQIDPGKVNTYMNQLGKPNAEIKQTMLENFLKSADKYKDVIADTHSNLGLSNPFKHSPLNLAKSTLEEVTPGAKLADMFVQKGLSRIAGHGMGATVGAGLGRLVHMPGVGAVIGEHALGPVFSTVLPAIVKPLMKMESNPEALKAAVDHAMNIVKGESLMMRAAKSIFKTGAEAMPVGVLPKEKDIQKLDKYLKVAQANPESLLNSTSKVAHYMPEQASAMSSTIARASTYLNTLRPSTDKTGMLDHARTPSPVEEAAYHRALSVVQQPLSVLAHIKEGTLTPQDVKTLVTVHPAMYKNMQNKLISSLTDHISKEKPVPYKTQLGISLFLGQPVDSSTLPHNMQANQMLTQRALAPQQPNQGQTKPSQNSFKKLSSMYATPEQAREQTKIARR